MQTETSGAASDRCGLKGHRIRRLERPRRRNQEFLHHRFSDRRLARIDVDRLRARVAYDFARNWLRYEGAAIPSAESLTHAAIYESDSSTSAVIHCHDSELWKTPLDRVPTTSESVACGTPAMAYEIIRLFKMSDVRSRRIFVMAGHEAGIVTFGRNLEDAFDVVMRERIESSPCI